MKQMSNAVYTNGDQVIGGSKTFSNTVEVVGAVKQASPCIFIDGAVGNGFDFGEVSIFTSTYFTQKFVRGGMVWNGTTGKVTVPLTGVYLMSGALYMRGAAGSGLGRCSLKQGNTSVALIHMTSFTGASDMQMHFNCLVQVTAIDGTNNVLWVSGSAFDVPHIYTGGLHTFLNITYMG